MHATEVTENSRSDAVVIRKHLQGFVVGLLVAGDFALNTLFYGEYGNTGPGANTAARVNWSTTITDTDPIKQLEVDDFLDGGSWLPSAGVPFSEYAL